MSGLVSFNMKIPASDKEELTRLAEELGIPAVTIVKSIANLLPREAFRTTLGSNLVLWSIGILR